MNAPYVSPKIQEEIRKHAFSMIRRTRECVGRLIVEDGIALRYERLRNRARGDARFLVRGGGKLPGDWDGPVEDGCEIVMVHSHPNGSPAPSPRDMSGAHSEWYDRPYGIFVMPTLYHEAAKAWGRGDEESGTLKFFRLDVDCEHYESLR